MNLNIRHAITQNMTNQSAQEVRQVVEDALQRGEEHLLPGLGVFFENLWTHATEEEKSKMTTELASSFASSN